MEPAILSPSPRAGCGLVRWLGAGAGAASRSWEGLRLTTSSAEVRRETGFDDMSDSTEPRREPTRALPRRDMLSRNVPSSDPLAEESALRALPICSWIIWNIVVPSGPSVSFEEHCSEQILRMLQTLMYSLSKTYTLPELDTVSAMGPQGWKSMTVSTCLVFRLMHRMALFQWSATKRQFLMQMMPLRDEKRASAPFSASL